jgi:hypothetical protein
MLRSNNRYKPRRRRTNDFKLQRIFDDRNDWTMKRTLLRWQHAGSLRSDHILAAVRPVIGRRTRHRTAALHGLRVLCHRGHAIPEWKEQNSAPSQNQE